MTNAISDTKQPKKKKKWQHCAKQARQIRHILQRIHVFIQFIMANCIWRFCVHDSSSPRDAIRGLGKKNKRFKVNGSHTGGECWRIFLFQRIEQISGNVFFLSFPKLAGAARSGECDQPVCLSVLSGEICGVTWARRATQLSGKIITQSRTFWITLEAIGRLGHSTDDSVTKSPLNETLSHQAGQEPNREMTVFRETGEDELLTFQ